MVGNRDAGHTDKEQNWIQPSNILAELDRYIFFLAGSVMHPHKLGMIATTFPYLQL